MDEFQAARWLRASHDYFTLFFPGYGEYILATKWVAEWLASATFLVTPDDHLKINSMISTYQWEPDPPQFSRLLEHITIGNHDQIGLAVIPYLANWNVRRFVEYLKRNKKFSLADYTYALGEFFEANKNRLLPFHNKNLSENIPSDDAELVFELVNDTLKRIGNGQNEPVGTTKLLHIISPNFFPLVDNAISEAMQLKLGGESLNAEKYKKWMLRVRRWFIQHLSACKEIEGQVSVPVLKLIDEGLYLMCSVNKKLPYEARSQLGLSQD